MSLRRRAQREGTARRGRRRFALLAACALLAVAAARAEDPEEGGSTAPPSPPPTELLPDYPSLSLGGFSDLTFAAEKEGTTGFKVGQFVLHVSSALSPRVLFFGELTLTARSDAGTGSPSASGFNAEVERALVRLDHSDRLKLSFGRYHTPVNWWNTAFHHGLWLQTTISRPEMTQFGGQFIPVHFVGGILEGAVPAGGFNLNYNLGVGNGRGSVVSRGGDAGDVNDNLAWVLNVFTKPDRPFGLQVGASVYQDRITLESGREFREWITAGHVVWSREDPEIIAEYARVEHDELGGGDTTSEAYYLQIAYRLPIWKKRLKPYYRFEKIDIPAGEPVFTKTPPLDGSLVGVRLDLANLVALKVEYRGLQRTDAADFEGLFAQVSYAF